MLFSVDAVQLPKYLHMLGIKQCSRGYQRTWFIWA